MTRPTKPIQAGLVLLVLFSLSLTGCVSLSDDITPPAVDFQPTDLPATQSAPPTSTSPAPAPTQSEALPDQGEGVVTVEISHQTGGDLQDGLEVLLEGYDQFDLVYQGSQTAGSSGQVVFSGVPLEPGRIFFASVPYGGAIYRSEIVEIGQDPSSLALLVPIFDTTSDGSGLYIDRVHVLLEFLQPGLLDVVEIYIISNLGEASVVPPSPGEPSLHFPLPAQAGSVEFEDGVLGERYLLTEDGFGDTVSIPPGNGVYQVLVYYTLPYQRNKLDFKQAMAYPVGAVVVMTPAGSIKVKGSGLEDLGLQEIPGGAVQVYSGSSLEKDGILEFRISGNPDSAAGETGLFSQLPQTLVIGLGAAGGLLFLVGVLLFLRNRRVEADLPEEDLEPESEREEILDSIIALEDLFQQGEISKQAYQKKRRELKDQLSRLVE